MEVRRIPMQVILWVAGVATLLVIAPNAWLLGVSWHDQQRIFQGATLFMTLFLWGWRMLPPHDLAAGQVRMLAAIFVLGAVSVLRASIPLAWSALEWGWWLALWALLECVAAMSLRAGRLVTLRIAGGMLAGFSLIYGIKLLAGLIAVYMQHIPMNSRELIDGFSNSRFFGQYATLVWPLLVALSADDAIPSRWRRLMTMSAALLMLAILVSQTRGTFYGLAAGLLLAVCLGVGREWWKQVAVAGMAGGGLYLGLILMPGLLGWVDISGMEMRLDYLGLSGRQFLWERAFSLMKQHPWFGVGPMGFVAQHSHWGAHPHSSILQIAVEWGIPVLLLILFVVTKAMVTLARAVRARRSDVWGAGLLVALSGSLTQSLVDGVLVMPLSQTALMCCAGLAVAWVHEQKIAPYHMGGNSRWRKFAAAMLAVLLVMTLWHAVSVPGNGLIAQDVCNERAGGQLKPRFWECGWVEPN